jgi:hypothetical protein
MLGPIAGIVSTIGTTGTHAATTFLRDTNWVEDMIGLARVGDLNNHISNRFRTTMSSSWMCMDVANASVWPFIPVNQFPCHDGLNQRWYHTVVNEPWNDTHFHSLVSVNSGKCLEVGPHNLLWQNTCTGASNQLFGRRSHPRGWSMITPNGLCVDIPGFSTTQGQRLQVFRCNGGDNQGWQTF